MGATSPENTGELRFFNATKLSNSGAAIALYLGVKREDLVKVVKKDEVEEMVP